MHHFFRFSPLKQKEFVVIWFDHLLRYSVPSVQIPIVDIVFDFENNYQFMVAKPLVLDLKAISEQSAMNVCFRAS